MPAAQHQRIVPVQVNNVPTTAFATPVSKKHRETDSLPHCLFPDNGGDHHTIFYYQKLKTRFEGMESKDALTTLNGNNDYIKEAVKPLFLFSVYSFRFSELKVR